MSSLTLVQEFIWKNYAHAIAKTRDEAKAFYRILCCLSPTDFSIRGTISMIATRAGISFDAANTILDRAINNGVFFKPVLWWDPSKNMWTQIWRSRIVYGFLPGARNAGIILLDENMLPIRSSNSTRSSFSSA